MKEEQQKILVVTHDGIFHADEVVAVALLETIYGADNVRVVRTRNLISQETVALLGEEKLVVDVGGVYDLEAGILDHHGAAQASAGNYVAAAELVCRWLKLEKNQHLFKDAKFAWVFGEKFENFVKEISNWDTRAGSDDERGVHLTTFSSIIAASNRLEGGFYGQSAAFSSAVQLAKVVIENHSRDYRQHTAAKTILAAGEILENVILVVTEFPHNWQEFAPEKIWILIHPSPAPGKWSVTSRNSSAWPLLAEANVPETMKSDMVFIHAARFTSSWNGKEPAIRYALESVKVLQQSNNN